MKTNENWNEFATHDTFPPMPESFHQRVCDTLDSLPDALAQPKHRKPLRIAVAAGLVAALGIGSTAFAVHASNWFPTLFPSGGDEALSGFVTTPEPDTMVVSNEKYEMELEAMLYDENAGAGIVSVRLTNLKGDSIRPFELSHVLPQYQKDGYAWANLAECSSSTDGQYNFNVLSNASDFHGCRFYFDETRSDQNTYYLEGAFILNERYIPGTPLRIEANEIGAYETDAENVTRCAPALSLTLPAPKPMPYLSAADGAVTLSQIGLHLNGSIDPSMYCVVDDLDIVRLNMKDGSVLTILDEDNEIDCTLYAMGESSSEDSGYDVGSYVLAQSFQIEDVESIVLNETTWPLS